MPVTRDAGGTTTSGPHFRQKVVLSEVQETLLMPLWARALQSRRWCRLLDDPKAVEVAEAIDYDFSKFERSMQTEIGCVLRAMQFDAWVKDFLARHPRGTVVDVGAGLNSRFERTDNGGARFFELDLPEAMAVRKQFFEEGERRTHITGSVLDRDWVEQVRATGGPYLVVIEGVLMYLAEADVRGLFAMIARELPGAMLAFDSLSRRGVDAQHRYAAMRHFDATFDWGIDETRRIEEWEDGYVCLDSVNLRHVATRNRHLIPALVQRVAVLVATLRRSTVNDYWMTLYRLGPA
ncbi:MAG: class I SAM-dependent methyltransferase [Planctomycetaceae bacterium]